MKILALLALLLIAASCESYWPQHMHDERNSGLSPAGSIVEDGFVRDWTIDNGGLGFYYFRTGVMAPNNKDLIVAGSDGDIRIVDTHTGTIAAQWRDREHMAAIWTPAVAEDEEGNHIMYVGNDQGYFYAVKIDDTTDLQVMWKFQLPGAIRVSPKITRNFVFIGSVDMTTPPNDGVYHAFDRSTAGTGEDSYQASFMAFDSKNNPCPVFAEPAYSENRQLLYVAHCDQLVAVSPYDIDVKDTTKLMKAQHTVVVNPADPFRSSVVLSEDSQSMFVRTSSGALYKFAYNAAQVLEYKWSCYYKTDNTGKNPSATCCNAPDFCADPDAGGILEVDELLASPSFGKNEDTLIIVKYATFEGVDGRTEGIYSVSADDGSIQWSYLPIEELGTPAWSRGTPSVDKHGTVFVGMQTDDIGAIFLALNNEGKEKFFAQITPNNPASDDWVGEASPVFGVNPDDRPRIFLASKNRINTFEGGHMCPTNSPLLECSGHGTCNHLTGECECDSCYGGMPNCAFPKDCVNGVCVEDVCLCDSPCYIDEYCVEMLDCGVQGWCDENQGICECDGCHHGDNCEFQKKCSHHGACTGNTCKCEGHWHGDDCEMPGIHIPNMGNDSNDFGEIFGTFIVLMILTIAVVGGLYFKKKQMGPSLKNPNLLVSAYGATEPTQDEKDEKEAIDL
eukprot:TRINITY_DN2583_c0_g3_i1.p1 TRINITY_DN2583_c0_g3~~TRINITY_DN2583_c0_g3_i1.p1  ORF type:complete len:675 (-),score=200.92 TRINITY_DN2583_c0_g3_i1:3112-5136(-)